MPQPTSRLIVINQTTTDFFNEWLIELAQAYGPIEVWTGTPPKLDHPMLLVRRLTAYDRSAKRTRLLTWLKFTVTVFWLLLIRTPRRIPVYAVTNPPFMPLILVLVNLFTSRKYVLLEYDIYPQIMHTMGIIGQGNPIYKLWWWWHGWSLRQAEVIITISELMAAELRYMVNGADLQIAIVPTWTNTNWLKPIPKAENPFVKDYGLQDKLVVIYSGNLGETHAIETIIDAAKQLATHRDIQFLIIGEGSKKSIVEAAIDSDQAPNIILLPWQPKDRLPYSLSSADISFVTLGKGYERLSMPSKTYDMMAVGNAILGISHEPSTLDQLVDHYHCGVNFAPDEVDGIAEWIHRLSNESDELHMLQTNSRIAAETNFSSIVCEPKLTSVIVETLVET